MIVPHELLAIVNGVVTETLVMVTGKVPLLPATTCCGAEVVFVITGPVEETWPGAWPKLSVAGVSVTTGAGDPIPLNSTMGSCPP